MLKLVERRATKKPVVGFYAKVDGNRIPVVWRRTEASLHHATINGRRALCGAEEHLQAYAAADGDLSRHLLTCNDCAELVFRERPKLEQEPTEARRRSG